MKSENNKNKSIKSQTLRKVISLSFIIYLQSLWVVGQTIIILKQALLILRKSFLKGRFSLHMKIFNFINFFLRKICMENDVVRIGYIVIHCSLRHYVVVVWTLSPHVQVIKLIGQKCQKTQWGRLHFIFWQVFCLSTKETPLITNPVTVGNR
jgi:hypothetical protein